MEINSLETLRAFLQAVASLKAGTLQNSRNWLWPNIETLLLEHGTGTEAVPSIDHGEGIHLEIGTTKECYSNAREAAFQNPSSLIYTEGVASLHGMSIEHAWLTHATSGLIYDPTWANKHLHRDSTPGNAVYLGLKMSLRFVAKQTQASGFPSVFFPNGRLASDISRHGLEFDGDTVIALGSKS